MDIFGLIFTFAIPTGILLFFTACSINEAECERAHSKSKSAGAKQHKGYGRV